MVIKSFLFIGSNHITDFINTIYTPHSEVIELLINYSDVQEWFLKVGLVKKFDELSIDKKKKYFEEILNYRKLIRDSFKNYLEYNSSLDNLIKVSNNILLKSLVHPQILIKDDIYVLEYISNTSNHNRLLSILAIEFIKLLSSEKFKYLKKCDNHKCSLYFIDTSKNHSRRWCSMDICGNRSKVNSFSKRKKVKE
ncbi:MAG: hypothetical protein CL624_09065 [Arcobacter sp.]|nr:hypothetical protein [Arcobacter sp.]